MGLGGGGTVEVVLMAIDHLEAFCVDWCRGSSRVEGTYEKRGVALFWTAGY